ncbi:MAG: outer membrane beta-barrel protein [Pseudomonadota bacterium]
MSKISAAWAAFLVGGLAVPFVTENAFAQSSTSQTSIPELEIRGSVRELDTGSRQGTARNNQDREPVEFGNATQIGDEFGSDSSDQSATSQDGNNQPVGEAQARRRQALRDLPPAVRSPQTRAEPVGPVVFDRDADNTSPRSNVAVDPVQTGTAVADETDPFAPTGLRLGTFDVQMSLEQSIGYSSNVSQNVGGEGGAFSQTDVAASFTSDWSRHEWQTNLSASFREPFNGDEVSDRSFSFDSQLRLDLIDGYTLTGRGFYTAATQEFTDTTLAPGAVDTPLEQNYGGSLELERSNRKFVYTLRGSVQNNEFEDADLGGGVTQSQEDQDNTLYSVSLRTGYEVSPAIIPFVEGIYSIRDFDLDVDRNGNNRDSDIMELRAGVEVDLGEKVQGEFSVGYLRETFDDPNIEDLTGVTFNGALDWSPERDTQVSLTVGTEVDNSITANQSGSLTYTTRLDYEKQVNDRFSYDAFASLEVEDNDAGNTTWEVGVGTQYWVNRFMALTTDIEYQNFTSDVAGSDFDEISARIGVRLQR